MLGEGTALERNAQPRTLSRLQFPIRGGLLHELGFRLAAVNVVGAPRSRCETFAALPQEFNGLILLRRRNSFSLGWPLSKFSISPFALVPFPCILDQVLYHPFLARRATEKRSVALRRESSWTRPREHQGDPVAIRAVSLLLGAGPASPPDGHPHRAKTRHSARESLLPNSVRAASVPTSPRQTQAWDGLDGRKAADD
jgi:hypothetical protein